MRKGNIEILVVFAGDEVMMVSFFGASKVELFDLSCCIHKNPRNVAILIAVWPS